MDIDNDKELKRMLESSASILKRKRKGTDVMETAALVKQMSKLLASGATDPSIADASGRTALHHALMHDFGDLGTNLAFMRSMLSGGCDPWQGNPLVGPPMADLFRNVAEHSERTGRAPSDRDVELLRGIVGRLIGHADGPELLGLLTDKKRGLGMIFLAAADPSGVAVEALLSVVDGKCDTNALVNVLDENDASPLLMAVRAGALRAVQALEANGADISLADRSGVTPLMAAAERGNTQRDEYDVLRFLVESLGERGALSQELARTDGSGRSVGDRMVEAVSARMIGAADTFKFLDMRFGEAAHAEPGL